MFFAIRKVKDVCVCGTCMSTHALSCFIFKYRVFGTKCSNWFFDTISFSFAEVVRNDNLKQETTEKF